MLHFTGGQLFVHKVEMFKNQKKIHPKVPKQQIVFFKTKDKIN